MNPLVVDIIMTWVRAGLIAASTYLIQHHVVTSSQGEALSSQLTAYILSTLPAIAALAWGAWDKYGARLQLNTALTMPANVTVQAVNAKIASGIGVPPATTPIDVVPVAKVVIVLLVLGLGMSACAHTRHAAVVAEITFSKVVFAIDDTETKACQAHEMSDAACAAANPKIAAALLDARAVNIALQHTPKNVAVPKNLPDLLTDLTAIQGIVTPLAAAPSVPGSVKTLEQQIQDALTQTIALVRTFTGGK